jgi:hypothetical protein
LLLRVSLLRVVLRDVLLPAGLRPAMAGPRASVKTA